MSEKQESKPWYRDDFYKGRFNALDLAQLDAMRLQEHHPAKRPKAVQNYYNAIEQQLFIHKRRNSFYNSVLITVIVYLFQFYFLLDNPNMSIGYKIWVSYPMLIAYVIYVWWQHSRKVKDYRDALLPRGFNQETDEGLLRKWELRQLEG